jgi:dienelactone hydrolase
MRRLRCLRLAAVAGALLGIALCAPAHAQQRVELPSLDAPQGVPVTLIGHWFAGGEGGLRPAVVLLHGCGGPYERGVLSPRMREYTTMLTGEGWHALVLDSFTPRGERELCTQTIDSRRVTQANRRLDALGALQWLAARSDVDARRIALLGWSNGGSTVLGASNGAHAAVRKASVAARAGVAFYPGCEDELKLGYVPTAPLLLLLGAEDDWTPAEPCVELAQRAKGEPKPKVELYPGAFHGFDSLAPLRVRTDVPNGVKKGAGVTVSGEPQARRASREAMLGFLREQLR